MLKSPFLTPRAGTPPVHALTPLLTLVLLSLSLSGCPSEPPEETPTPSLPPTTTEATTSSPGESPTEAVTSVPTQSPEASPRTTPETTATPSPTHAPTPTGAPTPTSAPTPTNTPGPTPEADVDEDGYSPAAGDCDDEDASSYPGAQEIPYDGVDQSCDGEDLLDVDQDGVTAEQAGGTDCDDLNQNSYPGAPEVGDGLDNDCDGKIDEGLNTTDDDGDGYSEATGDCDDADPATSPEGTELPYDGVDQDCSGLDLTDVDGDGFEGGPDGADCDDAVAGINPIMTEIAYDGVDQDCSGADLVDVDGDQVTGTSAGGTDCNDQNASIYPGALELPYDGVDQDCNGADLTDVDGDGAAGGTSGTDCNDNNGEIKPGATELPYDGVDQDCSGADLTDVDGDGVAGGPTGADCNDQSAAIKPGATELCDGLDNNCDGVTDLDAVDRLTLHPDEDGDGYGDAQQTVLACATSASLLVDGQDCQDQDASIYPGSPELCDGLDNDCDFSVDEGVKTTYYQDADGDGFGNASVTTQACTQPSGYVTTSTDCSDSSAQMYPGLTESCDGLDNNCDFSVDEGVKTTYYQDADGDGHGNPNVSTQACTKPSGYVTSNDDCADNNAALYGVCTSLPPQSGLIGFWKFEESSGATTSDSSGLSNHGRLMSGVTRVSGKAGSGVQTKDGACVTIADSASLSMVGAKALSYMAWIKYASPCNSDRGMILNKEHTYEMGIQCTTGDYFQEAIQLSDGGWFWTGGTSVTRNQWAHVAVVWDGSKVTQYLNGVVAGTRNLTGVVADRATGMGIGCRSVDEAGTTSSVSFFNGVLDEVAVYNRALSASELLSYVNATR